VQCLDRAIEDGVDWPIFLEDDARLEENAAEFCQKANFDEFARSVPTDALLVYIGSWCQFPADSVDPSALRKIWSTPPTRQHWTTPKRLQISFRHILSSYGTYAWVTPKRNLAALRSHYFASLSKGKPDLRGSWGGVPDVSSMIVAPDMNVYQLAEDMQLRVYDTQPTLVFHAAGYSNTKNSPGHLEVGRWKQEWPLTGAETGAPPTELPSGVIWKTERPRCRGFSHHSSNHSK